MVEASTEFVPPAGAVPECELCESPGGLLIASIACYRGLTVKGGAAGVGTNTTSSVVTAITTVIGCDTVYNVIYTNFFPT